MTFSGHIAVSALVLSLTHDPLLVVVICFVLHLAADAIPHAEWQPLRSASPLARTIMAADLAATFVLLFLLYWQSGIAAWLVSLAILAGLLPDLTDQWARKHLKTFRKFHLSMHTWPEPALEPTNWGRTVTGRTPTFVKVGVQTLLVLAAFAVLW